MSLSGEIDRVYFEFSARRIVDHSCGTIEKRFTTAKIIQSAVYSKKKTGSDGTNIFFRLQQTRVTLYQKERELHGDRSTRLLVSQKKKKDIYSTVCC